MGYNIQVLAPNFMTGGQSGSPAGSCSMVGLPTMYIIPHLVKFDARKNSTVQSVSLHT